MKLEGRLTLPSGLTLTPVAKLSPSIRARMDCGRDDYAMTRRRSRTPSKIINARTAKFLKIFRTPKTIVEAVLTYSRWTRMQPQHTLREVFPLIKRLFDSKLLVPADSRAAAAIKPSFQPGEKIRGYRVISAVQVLDDTELYRVTHNGASEAALKIARPGCSATLRRGFAREAAILDRLDGTFNPVRLESGEVAGRPFLVTQWIRGADAAKAARKWRTLGDSGKTTRIHSLCSNILAAYANLHALGITHGDVHPKNILAVEDGSVKILDFGLARIEGTSRSSHLPDRGGVGFYLEPEYAAARRAHLRLPACTPPGEQYAVAALLYFLLTGSYYLDFSLEKAKMLRQIATDPPLPFIRRRVKPSPAVEAVLNKALSKKPERRFRSLAEFKQRFEDAVIADHRSMPRSSQQAARGAEPVQEFLSETIQHLGRFDSELLTSSQAPTASINYGASGIAYALYRMACHANDPALLSLSDVWISRAEREVGCEGAFYHEGIGITPELVGRVSPYHTESGVHAVRALVSYAMGDVVSVNEAVKAFIDTSSKACQNLDLVLGISGTLLACCLLREAMQNQAPLEDGLLIRHGDRVAARILGTINNMPGIAECHEFSYLGIAHGWAGVLYAALRWCRARERTVPTELPVRLEQLATCCIIDRCGARWPKQMRRKGNTRQEDYVPGWCNGSAGFIHLWTLADQVVHDPSYVVLAEGAAKYALTASDHMFPDLCCGLGGQAYGLLNLYKHTGERRWLEKARSLAKRAIKVSAMLPHPGGLYKGRVGLALLAAELSRPESSCMPFFEHEGWSI